MVTSQSKNRSSPWRSRSLFSGRVDHAQKREENTRDETPFAPEPELLAAASRHGCRSIPSLLVQPKRASWVRSLPAAVMTSSRSESKFRVSRVSAGVSNEEERVLKQGFFFFFSPRPIYYLRPSVLSLLVVTQTRGHIAGSSLPLPTTVCPLHFYREEISALSSLVDSRPTVPSHARRSQQLVPFYFRK